MKDACYNPLFAYEIFRLGGIMTIVESIAFDHVGIEESCGILLRILSFHRARRVIRRCGGIGRLVKVCLSFGKRRVPFRIDEFTR